ncbi:alkane 1-monooxygenase [Tabrizicola sp. BL-A-41-H6]|uniref:alkane 1-monooxygenase n=1 Tax=Tabrizicola sp. BL-A-41-H6 TaxID=3421107 RepID=UPI003D66804E
MMRPLPLAAFASASLAPVALLLIGLATSSTWLWLALLYMAALTILLDQLIPLTSGTADGEEFPAATALLITIAAAHLAALPIATWAIAGDSGLSTPERIVTFFAAGLWFGQVTHPAAHELIHRPRRGLVALGVLLYTSLLFGQHASSHRLVHHRHVASRDDPNTARAGESYYRFARRAWMGGFRQGWQAETDRSARNSRRLHPYTLYLTGALACLALAFALAGPWGVCTWTLLALHAQSQILLSDYVQHYGLTRARLPDGRLEPVGPRHSWNTPHWFSSAMLLNAPRHSDHHTHPGRPFPALRLPDDAPTLPWPLPLAATMALLPSTWRKAMAPHLARWQPPTPRKDTRA